MFRWVHLNEAAGFEIILPFSDGDAADLGRKNLMVLFNFHNVVKFRDRPIRAISACFAIVDGIFFAHALEVGPECISFKEHGV